MDLNPTTTAVVAVHLQPEVIAPEGSMGALFAVQAAARDVVGVTNALLADVRTSGGAVVFTRVAFRPDYSDLVINSPLLAMAFQTQSLKEGSDKAEIAPQVVVADEDLIITHQRVGGFSNTDLDLRLRSRGINTLLITGVATNVSVESTARQASDLGYRTILVADACSAADDQTHDAAVQNLRLLGEVATSAEVRSALQASQPAAAPK